MALYSYGLYSYGLGSYGRWAPAPSNSITDMLQQHNYIICYNNQYAMVGTSSQRPTLALLLGTCVATYVERSVRLSLPTARKAER